jgi:DnaJ-class molecular chaperone
MKRINEYRKLFNSDATTDLKQLKSTYRQLVKEWHPDKFQEGDPLAQEAAVKSQKITDAYSFLQSMTPETLAANKDAYTKTITETGISDFKHKGLLLEVSFTDGTTYEYFGVTKQIYTKLINSDKQYRFAKRSIFSSFPYRKSKKDLEMAEK